MSVYIIAEIGPNHNGNLDMAIKMIEQLADFGVDAVKFQKAKPESLYSKDSFKVDYQIKNEKSKSPKEMSEKHQLSFDQHIILYKKCNDVGVDYLCSVFDTESLNVMNSRFDLPYYKIPSGEMFSVDLIDIMAKSKKRFILSTGMATYDEIKTSINLINQNFQKDITILHCVSNYPTPAEDVNLNVIGELRKRFDYPVGFSDHTEGNDAAIAAVALGATMIEKHVTINKSLPGPDHKASITIGEFGELIKSIRRVEKMLGASEKKFSIAEEKIKSAVRKSIVANKDLEEGHIISYQDISFKRPGTGISPLEVEKIIGSKVNKPIEADTLILYKDLKND